MPDLPDTEIRARSRARQLFGVRLIGAFTVMLGLYVAFSGEFAPAEAGIAIVVLGMAEFFALPGWLARQWREMDEHQ